MGVTMNNPSSLAKQLKLYCAFSEMQTGKDKADFKGLEKINITWFCANRKKPVAPYEILIEDYASLLKEEYDCYRYYPEAAVDELFTAQEIEELKNYFQDELLDTFEVREIKLPIKNNSGPCSALGCSNSTSCFDFSNTDECNLSFSLSGFIDFGN